MGTSCGALEIIELKDEASSFYHHPKCSRPASIRLRTGKKGNSSPGHSVEDDLSKLIAAIHVRTSSRSSSPPPMGVQTTKKKTIKRPVTDCDSQARGADISEAVTLKQALRRLCISHASEMAATKRLSKGSGPQEAGTIKRFYASLVVQSSKSGFLQSEGKTNMVEISLLSEKNAFESSQRATESCPMSIMDSSNKFGASSPHGPISTPLCASKTRIKDVIAPKKLGLSSLADVKEGTNSKGPNSISRSGSRLRSWKVYPRSIRLAFRNKTSSKRKGKQELVSALATPGKISKCNKAGGVSRKLRFARRKEYFSSPFSTTNSRCRIGLKAEESNKSKGDSTPDGKDGSTFIKVNESSRSIVTGECSQSSNSSTGDYSCSTSISYDSHRSNSSANGCRPHMSKDVRWVAIRRIVLQQGSLNLRNFKLLKKLGCGDIGTVYLAQLSGAEHLFALKIMDIEYLISRKKILRAETEKDILNILDHPFLPTLYAHFITDNLACLVMEYCSGGDLHVLRQKQPARRFSEPAARFYVAEVLLALEYLHMLGIIYRDLKPENILVREDGHIMLSDFDLSLRCSVSPTILTPSSQSGFQEPAKKHAGPCAENSCIHPFCIQPSWVPSSCLTPCNISPSPKSKPDAQVCQLPQLVAEPTDARSNSFVGTHEYLAPEIIRGDGHGSAVDWWTLGIFLFELLYGRTPFKGQRNDETLANIISESLWFPENPAVSCNARDLITGLVAKEPENRLGFLRGAAEIKQHPFFQGTNWALIRSSAPPVTPLDTLKKVKYLDFRNNGEDGEFKLF